MALLWYVIAVLLSLSCVDGRVGCWAVLQRPGTECIYNTAFPGGNEYEISYQMTANFSSVCCQALRCLPSSCEFVDVFCGHGQLTIRALPWEAFGVSVNPMMRCYGSVENFYSYTAVVMQST